MRENMRFVQAQAARLWAQVKLSDRDQVREFLMSGGKTVTGEEADAWRAAISRLIDTEEIAFRFGWNDEVLAQFAMAEDLPAQLCARMTWNVVRATGHAEFIISDHPVHIHDPEARPGRPGGWFSSPEVQVAFPVDRKTCLLLHPGPDRWREVTASEAMVLDLNMRSYASSQWKAYGSSQLVLDRARMAAKRNRRLVGGYKPKPQQMMYVERAGEHPDAFTNHTVIKGPDVPEIRRFKRKLA